MEPNYIDLQQKSLQLKKEILDIETQIINSGNNDIIIQLKEKINIFIDEFMKLYMVSNQEIKQLYNLNDKLLLQFNNLSNQYELIISILNNMQEANSQQENDIKENNESLEGKEQLEKNNELQKQVKKQNKLFTEYTNILDKNLKQNFDILNKKYEILETNYINLDNDYNTLKQQMNSLMNYINNVTAKSIGEQIINNDDILQQIINHCNILKQQKNINFNDDIEIIQNNIDDDDEFQSLDANKKLYPENYKSTHKNTVDDEDEWCSLPIKKKVKEENIEVHANEDETSILEDASIRPLDVIKNRIKLIKAKQETTMKPINIQEFFQYKNDFITSIFEFIPEADIFRNINRNDNMYKILIKYNSKNTREVIDKCLDINCDTSTKIKDRYYILLGIPIDY